MSVLVVFHEKHGDRYVQGDDVESVMWAVCSERVRDDYWYDEKSTHTANIGLGFGQAAAFMQARKGYEYEDYTIPFVEIV
jgi:hypothetical protein